MNLTRWIPPSSAVACCLLFAACDVSVDGDESAGRSTPPVEPAANDAAAPIGAEPDNPEEVGVTGTGSSGGTGTDAGSGSGTAPVAVLSSSGIFHLAGTTTGALVGASAGGQDVFVRAIDASGTALFTRQVGSAGTDRMTAAASGPAGSIAIVGVTDGDLARASFGGDDGFLVKFDGSGGVVFRRQIGTAADDAVSHVVQGIDGNVFVAGTTGGALSGVARGESDAFVIAYDASGAQLFVRQLGSEGIETVGDMIVAADGSLAIVGTTTGAVSGTNSGEGDTFVAIFEPDGSVRFVRQFGSEGNELATSLLDVGEGRVAVTGTTTAVLAGASAGGADVFVRLYGATGQVLMTRQFGSAADERGGLLALAADGRLIVAGTTAGSVVGTGNGGDDVFFRVYGLDGSIGFTRQFGSADADSLLGTGVDGDGAVVLVGVTDGALSGASAGGSDVFFSKYTADGSLVFNRQLGTAGDDADSHVVIDSAGNIGIALTVAGDLAGTSAGDSDLALRVTDGDGVVAFTRQFGSAGADALGGFDSF